MRFAVWLVVVGAACGRVGFDGRNGDGGASHDVLPDVVIPPGPFVPYWTSGTRIRARLLVPVEGGDPYFIGWRDTQLGMDCQNAIAADGVERCAHVDVRAKIFSDASCTTRLALARSSTCGGALSHAAFTDAQGDWHVHTIGAPYTGATYDNESGCVLAGVPSGATVHTLGPEVPAAQMAAAEYTNRPVGDFSRVMQGFGDGATVEIGSITVAAGACAPRDNGLGPSRCRPFLPRTDPVFADAACSQPAFLWDRAALENAPTTRFFVRDLAACSNDHALYDVTSELAATSYYRRTAATCEAIAMPSAARLYTGSQVASNPYPVGTIVPGPRRGRLGYLYWVATDGIPLAVTYYDHDLGVPCKPFNTSDGTLRCLPSMPTPHGLHANSTCTGQELEMTPSCFGSTPYDGPDYTSCIDQWNVRTLSLIGTTVSRQAATCQTFDHAAGFYGSPAGAELPPSMFAQLTEIVE